MTKAFWQSKTFWFNIILKLAGVLGLFIPQVQTFLASHPSTILILVGLVGNILRLITNGKLTLTDDLASPKI